MANETCPVCHTAEIISGKWTLLVIRDLADGCSRFCELERSLEGISPRTLSLRLRALEAEGIVERRTYPEVPPRVEYTPHGQGRGARAADRADAQLRAGVAPQRQAERRRTEPDAEPPERRLTEPPRGGFFLAVRAGAARNLSAPPRVQRLLEPQSL